MPKVLYFPYMHRRLEHTFTRAIVRVAYPESWEQNGKVYSGNTDHILGFVIADPTKIGDLVIHYTYTRRDYEPTGGGITACYRKQGIARKLVQGMMDDYRMEHIVYTLWGQEFRDPEFEHFVMTKNHDLMTYNPELFTTLLPHQWERGAPSAVTTRQSEEMYKAKAYSPTKF